MQDLKKESGLSVVLKDDFKLDLDISLLGGEFSSRTIRDMEKVLKDKIIINDDSLYYMYRDVRERVDEEKIKANKLRYDLTVILPRMIGREFNKTYGHYHPASYPEVYEVISGRALYLLQKHDKNDDVIDEHFLIEVNAGQKIKEIMGREIYDSRGNPTVESDLVLEDGSIGRASIPSGASKGSNEAWEKRDGGDRLNGFGGRKAV